MNSMSKKCIAVSVGLLMMLSAIVVTGAQNTKENVNTPPLNETASTIPRGPNYFVHAPIRINSNVNFDAAHGVTGGDGSTGNPWIIENYDIDGTGYGYCIYVGNTTEYFVVRNCYLHHASGVDIFPYFSDAGLTLYTVTNGKVTDSNVSFNNKYGVFSVWSSNCSIDYNSIWSNTGSGSTDSGICVSAGVPTGTITITHNVVSKNKWGVYLSMVIGAVYLTENNITWNIKGLSTYYCSPSTIANNNISLNVNEGIMAFATSGCSFISNTISGNGYGIYIVKDLFGGDSKNNRIYHNNIIGNTNQAYDDDGRNFWNNNYPSGGNYWDDYAGIDVMSGPLQDLPGSDGIGDTAYTNIAGGTGAMDNYPLMAEYVNQLPVFGGVTTVTDTGTGTSLSVSWTAATDLDTPIAYRLIRFDHDPSAAEVRDAFNTTWIYDGAALSYADTGLILGTTYYYVCRARDATLKWEYNSVVKSGVPTDTTPPAFAGLQSVTNVLDGVSLDLAWNAATDASPPITYYIYRGTTPGGENFGASIGSTTSLTYRDTGLTTGTTYYFVVRARDSAGREDTNVIEKSGTPSVYVVHAPIRINSNADFDVAHGVTGGDGSAGNPWIIENYDIDGTGYGYCIYVGNTTQHFVVRDCYLHHASGGGSLWYYSNSGMSCYATQNGTINRNNMSYNQYGVYFPPAFGGKNNIVSENNITMNTGGGVSLLSGNNFITDNSILGNGVSGVYIFSAQNRIENNSIINNFDGVLIYYFNNRVINNTISSNTNYGIYLTDFMAPSVTNEIHHNSIENNAQQAYDDDGTSQWDAGYPLGGNYWSDYTGGDLMSGPLQDQPGSDEIGDTAYTNIDGGSGAQDNYPLMGDYVNQPPAFDGVTTVADTGVGTLSISWTPATDVDPITYRLVRFDHAPSATEVRDAFNATWVYDGTALTYLDNGLTLGTTYYYVCRARDAALWEYNSVVKSGIPTDTMPPVFAGLQSVTNIFDGVSLDLAWNAATTASPPITYYIYRGTAPGGENFAIPIGSTTALTYRDTGLTTGTKYYYVVRARDSVEREDTNVVEKSGTPSVFLYFQVQAPFAGFRNLNMDPLEATIQTRPTATIAATGNYQIDTATGKWVSDVYPSALNMAGNWRFTAYGQVNNNRATGTLYAKVYRYNAGAPVLLFTTGYDDQNVGAYVGAYHNFDWNYTVGAVTLPANDRFYVELWLLVTVLSAPGTVNNDYTYTGVTTAGLHNAWYNVAVSTPPTQIQMNAVGTEFTDAMYANIVSSNNLYGAYARGGPTAPNFSLDKYEINFIMESTASMTNILITHEAQYSAGTSAQMWVYNFGTATWVTLGGATAYTADTDFTMANSITTNFANYVSAGRLRFLVAVNGRATGSVDHVFVRISYPTPNPVFTFAYDNSATPSVVYPTLAPLSAPYDIDLSGHIAGEWVFVSFPIAVSGNIQDILNDDTLGDGGTTWAVAKWYNAATPLDPWKTYRTGGLNDLTTIDNTRGVWLYLLTNGGDSMLTVGVAGYFPTVNTPITLTAGWNLVGYPSQQLVTAAVAFSGTSADRVGYWQAASPFVAETATLASVNMVPGNAYWVRVTANCMWYVEP